MDFLITTDILRIMRDAEVALRAALRGRAVTAFACSSRTVEKRAFQSAGSSRNVTSVRWKAQKIVNLDE